MANTMAEFTVRVIRDGDATKTQLVINGRVARESSPKSMSSTGNENYQDIFSLVFTVFSLLRD